MIKLRDDIVFEDPQSRIREYCEIEVCHGYDDRHSIDDNITQVDIDAANELYAMIDVYDKGESKRLLKCSITANLLSTIPNIDIYAVPRKEWLTFRTKIKELLTELLSIEGIGLAKATKVLHLKRPNLIPILDSFIIRFLLDVDISDVNKSSQVKIGIQALDRIRQIMIKQRVALEELVEQTRDLPILLTPLRLCDILCWTAEKWDIRGIHNAPYGIPHKSLLKSFKSKEPKSQATTRVEDRDKYVVFEDLERATGPKMHHIDCFYYKRWLSNPTSTTTWHGPFDSVKAWEICKRLSLRTGFRPSKHRCVTG